jgi:hypothetical protein
MGIGLRGAQRLMDYFRIDAPPGLGTTVTVAKLLPRAQAVNRAMLTRVGQALAADEPADPVDEIHPATRISWTRRRNASSGNGFDRYCCPEPSNSIILTGLPVIMRIFAPAVSACLASLVPEPSVSTTFVKISTTSSPMRLIPFQT